jgi:hypothetical protein
LLALIWVVFSFALAFAYGSGVFLKGVLVGLTSLALVLLLPLMGFLLIFSFGQDTVVQTVYSPEATYYAEVIDSDQGALGGDTLVEVYNTKKKIELFFLTVQKNPQRVYFGEWGEFQTMKLEWESEQILLINGWPNEIE